MNFRLLILLGILGCAYVSCTSDSLVEPLPPMLCDSISVTYVSGVKPIIDQSCAYSGCHVSGFGSGNFVNYAGLLPYLNDGTFEDRVITQRNDGAVGMPPNYAPAPMPIDLTAGQIDTIRCWLAAGHPQN